MNDAHLWTRIEKVSGSKNSYSIHCKIFLNFQQLKHKHFLRPPRGEIGRNKAFLLESKAPSTQARYARLIAAYYSVESQIAY